MHTMKELEEALKVLLLTLNNKMGAKLLNDLQNPEKCTPALYGQVTKFLQMHNFELSKIIMPDDEELKKLASAMPSADDYDPMKEVDDDYPMAKH